MRFNFKIQTYQTDAVNSVVNSFIGQKFSEGLSYRRDIGDIKEKKTYSQVYIDYEDDSGELTYKDDFDETGFRNEKVSLTSKELLSNIRKVQQNNNVLISDSLVDNLGACSLDIEMETGTGKTYVYIKTMFELNRKYGWSKFIVVVPSIAIREGVKKSFEMTQDHFMEEYQKKVRFFVYDSKNLNQLDSYSSNSGINCMIINMQAFNTSLKEGSRSKESRIIYDKRDEFGSRRPIDVIKANNPILILDEPQKMGGRRRKLLLKTLTLYLL
ncbi:DEAD/DEAH box helicase family protein [Vagococcus teuberi]|uniref:DEAD/DEAH box helicase family protein n=1 Tax=Vagococcus teuberi TaxID=519472 RepID=UPI000AE55C04|nr:DEAD/DEAH box helicase family protein [Vagococcus teuberi]